MSESQKYFSDKREIAHVMIPIMLVFFSFSVKVPGGGSAVLVDRPWWLDIDVGR